MNACPTCTADVPVGQKFCGECGTRVESACANCGTQSSPGQKFCGECGQALADLAAAPSPAPAAEQTTQGTERRLVSVLFLDLANFTPFTEANDTEDVRAFVTTYFDRSKEVIERFGGQVDKYIGDAVMAIWGANRAEEDDVERAVRAGLELIDMVAKLAVEADHPEMAARAGIMTGETSVGPGGNDTGLVIGDIVNTASRLQSIGDPGDVLVGATTKALADRAILFTDLGARSLKGKEETVTVYRAERILAERGGVGRADLIEAEFVGRDEELRLLKDQLHATTREQRARMVSIVGQAGIGKSRLVWEFEKYLDGLVEDVYWHHGRAPSYGDGLAMWSLAEMVRARCRIQETEEPATARQKLEAATTEYLTPSERAWAQPQLAALLGIDDAQGERSEMHAAIRLFFEKLTELGTVVLVFEDLHWADHATIDFVEELTEWSRNFPILVVALARPDLVDNRPEWGQIQRGVVSLHLPPLSDPDMHHLVSSLVPAFDEKTRQTIVKPAGGIPLFAIEMIRMLLNEGRLVPVDGAFDPVDQITDLSVPDSIQAVIGSRLDRLDEDDRLIIQDASILGQTFTLDALSAVSDIPRERLEARVASLSRREMFELIRDSRSPERGQYGFVQSLIREVAHGRITRDVRREKHLLVARWLEEQENEDVAGVVASHYLDAAELGRTDDSETAYIAVLRAIKRAKELHSHEQIVSLTERAASVIEDESLLAPMWREAADAAGATGDSEQGERFARRLLDYATSTDDEALTATALATLGEVLNNSQQPVRALELLSQHFDPTAKLPETEGHARLGASYARAMLLSGTDGAHRVAGKALAVAERLELDEVAADALITRGTRLFDIRRPREGRALVAKAVEIAKEQGFSATYLRGLANTAYTATSFAESIDVNSIGMREARRVGDRRMVWFFAFQSASYLPGQGRHEELLAMLDDPVLMDADAGLTNAVLLAAAYGHQLAGDPDAAQEMLNRLADDDSNDPQTMQNHAVTLLNIDLLRLEFEAVRTRTEEAIEMIGNPWNLVFAAWMGYLPAGSSVAVERFLEVASVIPNLSAMSPYRDVGDAMRLALQGDEATAADAARHAFAELVSSRAYDNVALGNAMLANVLQPGPARDGFARDARAVCDEHGFAGLRPLIEAILAGDAKTL